MIVKKLIDKLKEMPLDAEVCIENGYLYPAEITKVELRDIEDEQFVIIDE